MKELTLAEMLASGRTIEDLREKFEAQLQTAQAEIAAMKLQESKDEALNNLISATYAYLSAENLIKEEDITEEATSDIKKAIKEATKEIASLIKLSNRVKKYEHKNPKDLTLKDAQDIEQILKDFIDTL